MQLNLFEQPQVQQIIIEQKLNHQFELPYGEQNVSSMINKLYDKKHNLELKEKLFLKTVFVSNLQSEIITQKQYRFLQTLWFKYCYKEFVMTS